jgi:hypothetical protein
MSDCRYIFIKGAKAKNLKNIDIDILRSKRAVIPDYPIQQNLHWLATACIKEDTNIMERTFPRRLFSH